MLCTSLLQCPLPVMYNQEASCAVHSGRQSEDKEGHADGRPVLLPLLDLPDGPQALCP